MTGPYMTVLHRLLLHVDCTAVHNLEVVGGALVQDVHREVAEMLQRLGVETCPVCDSEELGMGYRPVLVVDGSSRLCMAVGQWQRILIVR